MRSSKPVYDSNKKIGSDSDGGGGLGHKFMFKFKEFTSHSYIPLIINTFSLQHIQPRLLKLITLVRKPVNPIKLCS